MSSRAKVDECVMRVRTATKTEEKVNAVAEAIIAFAAYVETIEHLLRHIETRLRHMELG